MSDHINAHGARAGGNSERALRVEPCRSGGKRIHSGSLLQEKFSEWRLRCSTSSVGTPRGSGVKQGTYMAQYNSGGRALRTGVSGSARGQNPSHPRAPWSMHPYCWSPHSVNFALRQAMNRRVGRNARRETHEVDAQGVAAPDPNTNVREQKVHAWAAL